VSAGQSSAAFSLTGLTSGTGLHTVSVSGQGYSPVSMTYTAPASCTVAPAPVLGITVTSVECTTATNQCTLSGTLSLTNATDGVLTVTDGQLSTTVVVTAGQTSANFTLTGLISGTGSRTVTASGNGYNPASAHYTAPASDTVTCSPPVARARVIPATCLGSVPQANAQIVLTQANPAYTYQYSEGDVFNTNAPLIGTPVSVPLDGVLVSNLANPTVSKQYTIRVYSSPTCYADVTVTLEPTVCDCPTNACIPYVIKQTKRAARKVVSPAPSQGTVGAGGQ
jgi:hypothetical protein